MEKTILTWFERKVEERLEDEKGLVGSIMLLNTLIIHVARLTSIYKK